MIDFCDLKRIDRETNFIIMSEVPIYLRRGNGICTKIMVSLTTPVSAFYQIASSVLKMDLSVILMYCQGVGLDRDNSETSLFQL